MGNFAYKAKRGPGQIIQGTVEADSVEGAVKKILQMGYSPVDVTHSKKKYSRQAFSLKGMNFFDRIPPSETILFFRQLSDLVEAGVPVLQALSIVQRQTRHESFQKIISGICDLVKEGATLSAALEQYPQAFSELQTNMVASGETGGNLGLVLNRLAEYLEKDRDVRAQIKSGLLYPALVLIVGAVTIFVLLTWVIPRITVIFEDLGQDLPLPTTILILVSDMFASFWWVMLLVFLGGVAFILETRKSTEGRLRLDQLKLRIPLIGPFLLKAQIGRFARTLGTLLQNGVPVVSALHSSEKVADNEVFKIELGRISEAVTNGERISGAMEKGGFFPEDVINMVRIGEETGAVPHSLDKIAGYYERQSNTILKRVTSLLEPVLILVLGTVVGFIVVAMLMPIFRMNMIMQ